MAIPKARFDIVANDKTGKSFKDVDRALKRMDKRAKSTGGAFAAMGGKMRGALSAGAIVAMAKKTMDVADAYEHSAKRIDINVESLQALSAAARDANSSNEVMERGLRNIKQRVQLARDGSKEYAKALEVLGVNTDELLSLPLERRLEKIAIGYKGAKDKSAAFAAVQKIIGEEAGPQLMEVLAELSGPNGFDGLKKRMQDANRIIESDSTKALAAAKNKLEEFGNQAIVAAAKFLTLVEGVKKGSREAQAATEGFSIDPDRKMRLGTAAEIVAGDKARQEQIAGRRFRLADKDITKPILQPTGKDRFVNLDPKVSDRIGKELNPELKKQTQVMETGFDQLLRAFQAQNPNATSARF